MKSLFLIISGVFISIFHPHAAVSQPVITPVVQVQQQIPQDIEVQTPTTSVPVIVSKVTEKPKATVTAPTTVPSQPVVTPIVTVPVPTPVVVAQDHCINISGIQPALPDGMEYERLTHYCVPIPVPPTAEELQQQAKTAYNAKVQDIKEQIIAIKKQYYIDNDNLEKVPGVLSQLQSKQQQLLEEANEKIEKLNLQLQELELNQ